MNANTTAAECLALFRLLGEEAFVALIALSDLPDARIREITEQVQNWSPMSANQAAQIRANVARRGRLDAKNDLLNSGITEQDVEFAFRTAGV